MIFKYKGIDSQGKKVKEKIEASSLAEAKAKIKSKDIIYQSIEEDSPSIFDNIDLSRKYQISAKELSSLCR